MTPISLETNGYRISNIVSGIKNSHETHLESISTILQSYRIIEVECGTPQHVKKWISQFDDSILRGWKFTREELLSEVDHLLRNGYVSLQETTDILRSYRDSKSFEKLESGYWSKVNFLKLQHHGASGRTNSQIELLELFEQILNEKDIGMKDNCSAGQYFIYLDDVVCSGERVIQDLTDWIKNVAPPKADLVVLLVAAFTSGIINVKTNLNQCIKQSGKEIKLRICGDSSRLFENRSSRADRSDVFWLSDIPDELSEYSKEQVNLGSNLVLRDSSSNISKMFSSPRGRCILEDAMLRAGFYIQSLCSNPNPNHRPLGYSLTSGFGFGATFFSYRNCPNNTPLAFWWGMANPDGSSSPLNRWYPLMPRKTFSEGGNVTVIK